MTRTDEEEEEEAARAAATELMQSQSIGYDMTLIYQKWQRWQREEEDDGFSLKEDMEDSVGAASDAMDMMDDGWAHDDIMGTGTGSSNLNNSMLSTDHHGSCWRKHRNETAVSCRRESMAAPTPGRHGTGIDDHHQAWSMRTTTHRSGR